MTAIYLLWLGVASLFAIVVFKKELFIEITGRYPYAMGFAKFAVLATFGSQLKLLIVSGTWSPALVIGQALAWGLIGLAITWAFKSFGQLAERVARERLLGWKMALFKSVLINVIFAYPMMIGHAALESLILAGKPPVLTLGMWGPTGFIVWTILLWWIPYHTFTFSQKKEWQILIAAIGSVALGIFTALAL